MSKTNIVGNEEILPVITAYEYIEKRLGKPAKQQAVNFFISLSVLRPFPSSGYTGIRYSVIISSTIFTDPYPDIHRARWLYFLLLYVVACYTTCRST